MDVFTQISSKVDITEFTINKHNDSYILRIGKFPKDISFVLSETELQEVLNTWIYELNAAYFQLRTDEFYTHAADGTIDDLVHGADAGGKQ